MNTLPPALALFALAAATMHAEIRPARLAETPVPPYVLPDPLMGEKGERMTTPDAWRAHGRSELIETFAREVYGRTPIGRPDGFHAEINNVDTAALDGRATRKEITIWLSADRSGPPLHVLLYVPNARAAGGQHPAVLGLNFYGNHTVHPDKGITLSKAWMVAQAPGVVDQYATEASRGGAADKWPIETILARGYAVATAYCGDLCPDRPDGLAEGVNCWLAGTSTEGREPDAWGAIGIWAWGLSRILDYLETDADIDATRVAVHGHSRLGKAALWAGAQDERFALVISNESGCGGAALSKRIHGETVARINSVFPHWFAKNFRHYNENEAALPVDQHQLLALIAPRPLHVSSAEDDDWADPRGEFLAVMGAQLVYRLFGLNQPGIEQLPLLHTPIGEALRYHIRSGPHDMTPYDWSAYLDFADRWLGDQRSPVSRMK